MANIERISNISMQVITFAGLAKSKYIEALSEYRKNRGEEYKKILAEGDEQFSQAHQAHMCILQDEMELGEPQITMLLAHAEDQLMAAETIKTLICEIIGLVEEVRNEK